VTDLELKTAAAVSSGLTPAQVARAIDAYSAQVVKALKRGEVIYTGLGIYRLTFRPARIGLNPKTGATISIRAKTTPRFTPKQALIDAVN
jgi:DNA-binding protein HU-beta